MRLAVGSLPMLLALLGPAAAGELYRWVDEEGNIHYTDRPPVTASGEVRSISYETPEIVDLPAAGTAQRATPSSAAAAKEVVMYGASWCPVCHRAKAYFARHRIPYTEYDVETSRKGKRDYERLRGTGVPIILVGGKRMNGFSPETFERLYGS